MADLNNSLEVKHG